MKEQCSYHAQMGWAVVVLDAMITDGGRKDEICIDVDEHVGCRRLLTGYREDKHSRTKAAVGPRDVESDNRARQWVRMR